MSELKSDVEKVRTEFTEKIQSELSKSEVSVSNLKAAATKGAAGTSWMDFIALAIFAFGTVVGMLSVEISGYFGFSTTCSF